MYSAAKLDARRSLQRSLLERGSERERAGGGDAAGTRLRAYVRSHIAKLRSDNEEVRTPRMSCRAALRHAAPVGLAWAGGR